MNTPRQARSEETLARLERAAIDLLERQVWDAMTVSALVRRARSSIGSFYARFPDKTALLDHLDERYAQELTGLIATLASDARALASLEARARRALRALVRFHRERRGLLRTLLLTARTAGAKSYRARTQRINAAVPLLIDDLLRSPDIGRTPRDDVERAVSFTFSALRDRILFPESLPDPPWPDDDAFAEALLRNFLGYLGRAPEAHI